MPRKPKTPTTRGERKTPIKTKLEDIVRDLPDDYSDEDNQGMQEIELPKLPKWKPMVVRGSKDFNDYMDSLLANKGKEGFVSNPLQPYERKHLITFASAILVKWTMTRMAVCEELVKLGLSEQQSRDVVKDAHDWITTMYKEQVETMRQVRLAQMTYHEQQSYQEGRYNMAFRLTKEINKVLGLYTENIKLDITHTLPNVINIKEAINPDEIQDAEEINEEDE